MWSILSMIEESGMIKASDLKVGDKITCIDSKEYRVVYNRYFAPVKRLILRDCGNLDNIVLFYDDDVEYAKNTFGIDLIG